MVPLSKACFQDYPFPEGESRRLFPEGRLPPPTSIYLSILLSRSDGCISPDIPDYPSAAQVLDYLESYAVHFNLLQHCRFNIHITRVDRSSDGQAWTLSVTDDRGPRQERFDKVLISTGPFSTPFIPQIEGLSEFNGKVIHAQAYKG